MNRIIGSLGALVALVLFIGVNFLANATLSGARADLTEENLFTLSEGTRSIAANLDEPIRLYLYFSKGSARELPQAKEYAQRVEDVLEEYVRYSNGKLILEVIDPEPFSEDEERAVREGISGVPTQPDPLYFGLVGTNSTDDREVIPFFGDISRGGIDFESKERFLEYDISRLIYSLAHPQKKKVGILSPLPLEGGTGNPALNQGQTPRWRFLDQLEQFFDPVMLSVSDENLPTDLDALILVHPRELSDTLLYAVDQFVLNGGKLVAFVDPHCEVDMTTADPTNPMGQIGQSKASDINRLLKGWGCEVVPNKVIGDYENALSVPSSPVPVLPWLNLTQDRLAAEDPVTSLLQSVYLIYAGQIRALDGATTTLEPLITSSERSMEIDVGQIQFRPDPQALLDGFVSGGKSLTLAARINGDATTGFPGGLPVETEEGSDAHVHRETSNGPIHVVVVGDADMLRDQLWIRDNIIGGLNFGSQKVSDNCDFLVNSLENLTGGEDLISIRARGRFSRPFDVVDEIERNAKRDLADKEAELQRRMSAAEAEINRIQQEQQDPNDPTARFILSPKAEEAYAQAIETRLQIRRELRDVRHSMDKDIKALGTKLRLLNIFALPALITIVAVGLGLWRVQRRGK